MSDDGAKRRRATAESADFEANRAPLRCRRSRTDEAASRIGGPVWTPLKIVALERHTLEFVSLVDLGALFWCRPGAVLRHLAAMRTFSYPYRRCAASDRCDWSDTVCPHDAGFGARLALRRCASLVELALNGSLPSRALVALVRRNRATLRRIATAAWIDPDVRWATTHCPLLETFRTPANAAELAPLEFAAAAAGALRHVSALTVVGRDDSARFRSVLLFELPWRLRAFAAPTCSFAPAILERVTARFTALEQLTCAVALRGDPNAHARRFDCVDARARRSQLRRVLRCVTTLARLTSLRLTFEPLAASDEATKTRMSSGSASDYSDGVDIDPAADADADVSTAADRIDGREDDDLRSIAWRLDRVTRLHLTVQSRFSGGHSVSFTGIELQAPDLRSYIAEYLPMDAGLHVLRHSTRLERFSHLAVDEATLSRSRSHDGAAAVEVKRRTLSLAERDELRKVAAHRLRAALRRSTATLREIAIREDNGGDSYRLTAGDWAQLCCGNECDDDDDDDAHPVACAAPRSAEAACASGSSGSSPASRSTPKWPLLEEVRATLCCEPRATAYIRAVGRILRVCPALRCLKLSDAHMPEGGTSHLRLYADHTRTCGHRRQPSSDAGADDDDDDDGSSNSSRVQSREAKVVAPNLTELQLSRGTGEFWAALDAPRLAAVPIVGEYDHDVTAMLRTVAFANSRRSAAAADGGGDAERQVNVHIVPDTRVARRRSDEAALLGVTGLLVSVASHSDHERVCAHATADAMRGLLSWLPDSARIVIQTIRGTGAPLRAAKKRAQQKATAKRKDGSTASDSSSSSSSSGGRGDCDDDDGKSEVDAGWPHTEQEIVDRDRAVLTAVACTIFDSDLTPRLAGVTLCDAMEHHPARVAYQRARPDIRWTYYRS